MADQKEDVCSMSLEEAILPLTSQYIGLLSIAFSVSGTCILWSTQSLPLLCAVLLLLGPEEAPEHAYHLLQNLPPQCRVPVSIPQLAAIFLRLRLHHEWVISFPTQPVVLQRRKVRVAVSRCAWYVFFTCRGEAGRMLLRLWIVMAFPSLRCQREIHLVEVRNAFACVSNQLLYLLC